MYLSSFTCDTDILNSNTSIYVYYSTDLTFFLMYSPTTRTVKKKKKYKNGVLYITVIIIWIKGGSGC